MEKIDGIRLVMFDMDGVLFDSMPMHVRLWRETVAGYGFDMDERFIYLREGMTGYDTVDELFLEQRGRHCTLDEGNGIYKAKNDKVALQGPVPVMPGALETLRAVKDLGIPATIVTGSPRGHILGLVRDVFGDLIRQDWIVAAGDCPNGKPAPDPYLSGLRNAGVNTGDDATSACPEPVPAIVVENAPLGVRSAKAAGCFVIAANTGPLPDSALEEAGADIVLPSMHAVASWFNALKPAPAH